MNQKINQKSAMHNSLLFKGIMIVIFFSFLLFNVNNNVVAITQQMDFGSSDSDVIEFQTYLTTDVGIYSFGLITGNFNSSVQSATEKLQVVQKIVPKGTSETTSSIPSSSTPAVNLPTGLPLILKITTINVDSTISPVGLTADGAMHIAENESNVVWYELGPRPGENGNAVIAGHYDGKENGKESVFDNLNKLVKGDKLSITDDQGIITSFVVREIRILDANADASDVFFSNDGKSHLVLITCYGIWDDISKSYPERFIVFADKLL